MNNDFAIGDLMQLVESAKALESYNQLISANVSSLRQILSEINANWVNPDGLDLESINTSMNDSISKLENQIQPLIKGYIKTLYAIEEETSQNQNQTLSLWGSSSGRLW